MKKTFILLLVLTFLCGTLTACGEASNSAVIKADDLKETITAYVEDDIKSVLKNPQSLMINNLAFNEEPIEIAGRCYCNLDVDFSAQNGFGGYDREVVTYYICHENGVSRSLSRREYYCELDTARYGDKLDSIGGGVLLSYGCSADTAKSIYKELSALQLNTLTAFGYNLTDNIDNIGYVKYVCELMGLEGSITYTFIDDKVKTADFWWVAEQGYLDPNKALFKELGVGQTATCGDIEILISKIDEALGINHVENKREMVGVEGESMREKITYEWVISEERSLFLRWVVSDIENVDALNLWIENVTSDE